MIQGDRGEIGPPGPAGFAGPPVSEFKYIEKGWFFFHGYHSSYNFTVLSVTCRGQMVSPVPKEKLVKVDRRERLVLLDLRDHLELLDLWWVLNIKSVFMLPSKT